MSTITSTAPTLPTPRLPLASPAVYRMTVDEYERIADALDAPVELIDGYLVERTDMNPPHVLVTERLRRRLDRMVGPGWFVREDKPVRIPDFDEPRPDLAIVRGDPETYDDHHPGPEDVALLIEVSQASLGRDQGNKWLAYAPAAAFPSTGSSTWWIVRSSSTPIRARRAAGPA
ncbi:MAG TPA: Uma2 family endonuclease [Isosphaeraceae bacterium]|nr:Uma2 family endonuclease [Isosphaeraceae bacterium]